MITSITASITNDTPMKVQRIAVEAKGSVMISTAKIRVIIEPINATNQYFLLYYYLIKSFKRENEDDLMQNKDNDAAGLTPGKEADEVMRKSYRLKLNIFIK